MRSEDRYDSLFQFYGWKHEVDWLLLKAQVKAESSFNPHAVSSAGARGLAQFMPGTFHEQAATLGLHHADAFNPEHSIHCQAHYMAWLFKITGPPAGAPACAGTADRPAGNLSMALAAYNWGIGNLRGVASNEDWIARLPEETQKYLERIEKFYEAYRKERGERPARAQAGGREAGGEHGNESKIQNPKSKILSPLALLLILLSGCGTPFFADLKQLGENNLGYVVCIDGSGPPMTGSGHVLIIGLKQGFQGIIAVRENCQVAVDHYLPYREKVERMLHPAPKKGDAISGLAH